MNRVLFLLALAACGEREISGTACSSDTDCNLFNAQGTCQSTGFCSFPDPACLSGERYAPAAGDSLGGTCIGDGACGTKDLACCAATVCADHLTCVIGESDTTCQCGGADQPCCDGTTCDDGLRCGDGAVCSADEVTHVAVGAHHVCAVTADGVTSCWGLDFKAYGRQLALGTPVIDSVTPREIAMTDVAEIRGGDFHTCARKTDGTLWCWGHNSGGQLGNGAMGVNSVTPVQVTGLSNVTAFEAGRLHTCAIGTVDGNAGGYCWGRGGTENRGNLTSTVGRLGNGAITDSALPVAVTLTDAMAGGATVKDVSAGNYHSCVLMSDDTVWCWGRNNQGQLGNGTLVGTLIPTQADLSGITIPAGVTIDEISCSSGRRRQGNTCIRLSDATVYCWGYNGYGELGDGLTANRSAPSLPVVTTDLAGAKPVALAAGQDFRCARMDTGALWCWGRNKGGALGTNGTLDDRYLTPQKVAVISGVTSVATNHHTACAIDGAKHLYCWGSNRRGTVLLSTPVTTADLSVLQPTRIDL